MSTIDYYLKDLRVLLEYFERFCPLFAFILYLKIIFSRNLGYVNLYSIFLVSFIVYLLICFNTLIHNSKNQMYQFLINMVDYTYNFKDFVKSKKKAKLQELLDNLITYILRIFNMRKKKAYAQI